MKIQGPNPYLNLYRTNQKHPYEQRKNDLNKDRLDISQEALQLQKNKQDVNRKKVIANIKTLVQSGEYKIDYQETAEKLVRFWRS